MPPFPLVLGLEGALLFVAQIWTDVAMRLLVDEMCIAWGWNASGIYGLDWVISLSSGCL